MEDLGHVFLEFVRPELERRGPVCQDPCLGQILGAAAELWNAFAEDQLEGGDARTRRLRQLYETDPDVSVDCVERLITRRREAFGRDRRIVAEMELSEDEAGRPWIEVSESDDTFEERARSSLPGSTSSEVEDVSGMLLEYASPFLPGGTAIDREDLLTAMGVAIQIWNAMVLDTLRNRDENLRELRRRWHEDGWPPPEIVDGLVARKRTVYGSDLRYVEHHSVREDECGAPIFRAVASVPHIGPHRHSDL